MARKRKKKRKPKNQLGPRDYLDEMQVRFILEILKGEARDGRFRTAVRLFIFQLLLNTGLRRGEAAGLELRDMPQYHGKDLIDVRWQVAKGGRARTVIISDKFKELIGQYTKRFCKGCSGRSPLLRNEYGNRMTPENIYNRIKTIGRHAAIGSLHPHMMRHTYLSLLYGVDKDQMLVKNQGGHVKMDTTNIYVHIGDREQKRQVSRLAWLAT